MIQALNMGRPPGDPDAARQAMVSRLPLRRYGQPDEVANLVVWLLSNEASYITGSCRYRPHQLILTPRNLTRPVASLNVDSTLSRWPADVHRQDLVRTSRGGARSSGCCTVLAFRSRCAVQAPVLNVSVCVHMLALLGGRQRSRQEYAVQELSVFLSAAPAAAFWQQIDTRAGVAFLEAVAA